MNSIEITYKNSKTKYLISDAGLFLQNLERQYNRLIIIVDSNIENMYHSFISKYLYKSITATEVNKSQETINSIYSFFLQNQVNKSDIIIGIGGGITTDITGFVASSYMRGIDFGFIPTTLLAMVDASIGGKNGINYDGYKNMIGSINQPKFICSDILFLKTLPHAEVINGYAEIIKSAAIADSLLIEELFRKQYFDLSNIILKVANIKVSIVSRDEKEQGIRKVLNFGHTLAHSIEKEYLYPHGVAVALGMIVATQLSFQYGYLSFNRSNHLIKLIYAYFDFEHYPICINAVVDAIRFDKKRNGDSIDFILLQDLGTPLIKKIPINILMENLYDICVTR